MNVENPRKSAQNNRYIDHSYNGEEGKMLKFPNTKNILWDHTSIGSAVNISISYFRKPKLCITEKVLRFAQRHVESKSQSSCGCALVGQLTVDDDGEGLTFTLDRFDPGGDSLNNSYSLTPGDIAVPFQVAFNSKTNKQSSTDDYFQALQLLRERCCSKNSIDLSNFLLTKGWCNIYTSGDRCIHHLEFDVVTMATEFKATPIPSVPIVPTALSKNLSGPMSMSHLQGEPKTGYLTMDHTRKVLLVLDSDPKVANLPLVGIWVSGVSFSYSPYIWACCLRYLHNSILNDRVCVPPESFLMVLYNPLHSRPEFYEVVTTSGKSDLTFDLFNGYEAVNLPKTMSSAQNTIQIEMGQVDGGQKKDKFDGAIHLLHSQRNPPPSEQPKSSVMSSVGDDMTPRNHPAPHRSQLPVMTSMVPEVSLLFGEDSGVFMNPKKPSITQGKPNGVTHTADFTRTKLQSNLPVLHEHPNAQQQKSAPKFNGQPSSDQNSSNNGRLAQHYLNSVPKSDNFSQSRTSQPNTVVSTQACVQNNSANQNYNNVNNQMFPNPNMMYSQPNTMPHPGFRAPPQMNGYQQPYPPYPPQTPMMYGQGGYVPTQGMMPQQMPTQPQPPMFQQPPPNQGFVQPIAQPQRTVPCSQNQFVPITPQYQQNSRNYTQERPPSQADSSKSSDDSGLSVTPEKQILQSKQTKNSATNEEPPDSILQSQNINWNQVPPEVYQLLVQQDNQLKKLQSQIQMLIANQSNSTQNTTTTELDSRFTNKTDSTQNASKSETCSVAVNTTMMYPEPPEHHSVSLQTSPQKQAYLPSSDSGETTPRQGSQCSYDGRTPAEIRHRGVMPFSSTQKDKDDFDLDASQDLSSVAKNMALHDKTIDSIQSDMIVDMPSYHSSPTRSERSGDTLRNSDEAFSTSMDKSPTSASMCCREDDSDSEEHENVDTNDKEYYDRLMDNIQVLLNQQSSDQAGDTLQNDTLQQSIMLGQYINSIQQCRSGNVTKEPLETTFIPKINYMSMMFDSDSDSSMEINAMAMKYLKDEQLTQMTKLQTRARLSGNKGQQKVALLRHILSDDKEATPNVTTMGMSPNDLTFATRKYMEKHGLLNDSKNSVPDSTGNDSYQLRVNFSTITGRSESPIQLTQEVINNDSYKTPVRQMTSSRLTGSPLVNSQQNTPLTDRNRTNPKSPIVDSKMNSPYINQGNRPYIDSQCKSPFINSQSKSPHINSHNVSDQPGRVNYNFTPSPAPQGKETRVPDEQQNQYENQRRNFMSERPLYHEDEDKILDITRLRMLPKLL